MNNNYTCAFLFFLISLSCFADTSAYQNQVNRIVSNGIGLGGVIAVVCSWQRNKSILWVIIHALFGWFYVIYFALTREDSER
jgi:protein-S-isoprenylcysteine O-methyltransferase Ste14